MKNRLTLIFIATILLNSCAIIRNFFGKKKSAVPPPVASNLNPKAVAYIERYKAIAITKMKEYGIPASITLAQGLLESANGMSRLAIQANNHFGIKCASNWKGKTILQNDDTQNECFRVYDTPEKSYKDHSEFLSTRKHYAFLFKLERDDYKAWAKGLKQAGYATNPRYPDLLISLIQRYHLDQYDRKETKIEKNKIFSPLIVQELPLQKQAKNVKPPTMKTYEVKQGDTIYTIAKRFDLSVDNLRVMNSLRGNEVKPGQLLQMSK